MNKLHLDVDIVPGKSAAGFAIGSTIDEFAELKIEARVVSEGDSSISELLRNNQGVLWVKSQNDSLNPSKVTIYFLNDVVRLNFNASGVLYNVFVFDGYKGSLATDIHIGDPLTKVSSQWPLYFDEGMNYIILIIRKMRIFVELLFMLQMKKLTKIQIS